MYPEDRVLVGVINRKRDLNYLLHDKWYRIPQVRMPQGVYTEYIALFLSGAAAKGRKSGVHYYGQVAGLELAYRRDLLPKEANHKRADETYYKVQFETVIEKVPPVLNPSKRTIGFIFTTWDRFVNARQISDLYSRADYFVDRIYHALQDKKVRVERYWDADYRERGRGAGLRILCDNQTIDAYTERRDEDDALYIDPDSSEDEMLKLIRTRIQATCGPVTLPIPPIH